MNRCSQCALQENLWLCLQCGNVGCGRSQFGGVGGNSHALAHAQEMTHTVAVKLNSITPEGSADIFCYSCNEERVDPEISLHLARWGIAIAEQQKTEKSLVELQIEHNLSWEFTMTSDDGSDLKPVFGPGLTGLRNLGNTCYLASILQCLFSVPEIGDRYFTPYEQPPTVRFPAEDLETQLRKMADGLLSGRYSAPNLDSVACTGSRELAYQSGLSPGMFKHLVGRGHGEFSTMRQQDAFEFLLHLFKLITVSNRTGDSNPVASFRFALEHRLQCLSCGKVRYKIDEQDNISVPVPIRRLKHDAGGNPKNDDESKKAESKFETVTLEECLDIFTEEETVELTCSGCGSTSGFRKRSLFKTFPQNLVINARRFELLNWVPTKLDIPVEVGNEPIDFSKYLSPGVQEGEDLLEDEPAPEEARFSPNPEAVNALLSMGFTETRIHNALHATGNTGADAALDWLIAHMDDPNIDKPSNLSSSGTVVVNEAEEQSKIDQLVDMGIGRLQARKALRETSGDVARAIDWVFSHPDEPSEATNILDQSKEAEFPGSSALPAVFQLNSIVCHKGTSVHTG